jgi:hypothetical protein
VQSTKRPCLRKKLALQPRSAKEAGSRKNSSCIALGGDEQRERLIQYDWILSSD